MKSSSDFKDQVLTVYQVGNAKGSFAGALEEEGVVGELGVGGLQGSEDAGHGDRSGALDVVVEGAVLVAVLLKEPARTNLS